MDCDCPARLKTEPRRDEFAGVGLENAAGVKPAFTKISGVGFAAGECEIDEVPDADGEWNQAKRRRGPGVWLVFDAGDGSESSHEADRAAHEQYSILARTRRGRNFRLERNRDAARDGRHAFIGTQLLHAIIRVHGG